MPHCPLTSLMLPQKQKCSVIVCTTEESLRKCILRVKATVKQTSGSEILWVQTVTVQLNKRLFFCYLCFGSVLVMKGPLFLKSLLLLDSYHQKPRLTQKVCMLDNVHLEETVDI